MIAEGICRLRRGQVERRPGYDGEYGTISLFEPWEMDEVEGQMSLFLPSKWGLPEQRADNGPRMQGVQASDFGRGETEEADMPFCLEKLNEAQRKAAMTPAPAIAVTAGPGTGKTGTLTARILCLLKDRGVKPSEITAVTFTNKAAAELRVRLEGQAGAKRALRLLNTGTFHSICLKLLQEQGFDRIPASEEMLLELAGDAVKETGLDCTAAEFLRKLSLIKSRGGRNVLSGNEAGEKAEDPEAGFQKAAARYEESLEAEGACDFDDLLLETLKLLKQEKKEEIRRRRFSYLLVDEFQDVNPVQFQLIQAWNKGQKELFVIGDPDQAIYGFRGSDPGCFEALRREYPGLTQIALSENYRSVPSVLEGAQALISMNPAGRENCIL